MDQMIERVPTNLSVEDFETLPQDGDYKLELSATMLIREPPPGHGHGALAARLAHRIQSWSEAGGGGVVATDAGFVLSHEPPIVRAPDVSWVAGADPLRLDERAWRGAPDLAIEIASPWDRPADIQEKVDQYHAAGVRLIWVVYPRTRQTVVHRAFGVARTVNVDGVLDGEEVLRDFLLPLVDVFGAR